MNMTLKVKWTKGPDQIAKAQKLLYLKKDSHRVLILLCVLLGPLCYKLIIIVNCYLETGLTCFAYLPKALYHCVAPIVIET